MTSIGDSLKRAREERGLDIERVAEETRIARRFIAALEVEDFSVFPGEPYALGFLRNYAEYLGLDANDLAASFRNLRIQEQPVPIQELIPAKRTSPLVFVGAGALVVVLLIGALLVFGRRGGDTTAQAAPHSPTEYRMEKASLDRRFWVGDSVIVKAGQEAWKVTLSSISDGTIFETPLGQRRLSLGEEAVIDFDKDGEADLRILLTDIDKKDPSRGANLRMSLLGKTLAAIGATPAEEVMGAQATGSAVTSPAASEAGLATATAAPPMTTPPTPLPDASNATKEGVIFEAAKGPWPFVVSVTFRASCMFRYEVDKRDRDERYYQKGDTVSINAQNSVKLWASNAQSAAVLVQASGGKSSEIDLGGAGEIAVKRIAWVQNENKAYTLSLFEVD